MNGNEYGIILLKPDGVRKGLVDRLLQFIEKSNLEVIEIKKLILKKEDIIHYIRTSFDTNKYSDYMSSGYVIAVLVYGQYAINELIKIKRLLRSEHGFTCDDMMNLVHSVDLGNEYYSQFKLLFPERDIVKYSLYADMNLVLQEEEILNELYKLDITSNVSWVGIILEYGTIAKVIKEFYKYKNNRLRALYGLKYKCAFKDKIISVIGYLPETFDTTVVDTQNKVDETVESYINWIKENGGITVLDYRPLDELTEELLIDLRAIGLDGVVVYDPRFSQNEVAKLEYIVADKLQLALTGGSNGYARGGELTIDKKTFEILVKNLKLNHL